MKILFIADVPLENPTSGSEQVLYQQATGLVQQGMDVYAITRQSNAPLRLPADTKLALIRWLDSPEGHQQ